MYVCMKEREKERENIVKQNLAFESLLEAMLGFRTVSKNVPVEGNPLGVSAADAVKYDSFPPARRRLA